MEIIIFRHGETDWNKMRKIQGHSDIPLNENGKEQASKLAEILTKEEIEVVYSSDLLRARETADIATLKLNIEVIETDKLREVNLGDAEGMLVEDVIQKYGEKFWKNFRMDDPQSMKLRFPGGESRGETRQRVREFILGLKKEAKYKKIGISTHGAALRTFVHSFLPDDHPDLVISNCVCYKLIFKEENVSVIGPL